MALLATAHWHWPLLAAAAFILPMAAALYGSRSLAALGAGRAQLGAAAVRLIGLVWLSVLMTPRVMPLSPRRREPKAAVATGDSTTASPRSPASDC